MPERVRYKNGLEGEGLWRTIEAISGAAAVAGFDAILSVHDGGEKRYRDGILLQGGRRCAAERAM